MSLLQNTIKKLQKIKESQDAIIREAVLRTKDEIEAVQANQMQEGRNADGEAIGVLRNPAYARRKKASGGRAPLGMVDLKNTGAFQKGIVAQPIVGGLSITSRDKKTPDLVEKYGDEIFGFDAQSVENVRPVLMAAMQFEINRFISTA